ncbi:MAG: ABC transporter permease, partial [Ginsengibacter sp.]
MFRNYLKTAWRILIKDKMHSFINIAGLSTGMAVAILIGLWMYDEISFDKNFDNYENIAQVLQNQNNNGQIDTWTNTPYPLAKVIRTSYGGDFQKVVMAGGLKQDHLLNYDNKKLKEKGGFFEAGAPDMFSLKMLSGNRNSLSDPTSVLLSASVAKAYFGDEDPLNRLISIDQFPPLKVTGVYKDFPQNSSFANIGFMGTWDFFFNNTEWLKTMPDPWRPNFTQLFVLLNDHANIKEVNARIKDAKLININADLQKKKPELFLQPMSKWHLYAEFKNGVNVGGAIQYVWMFGIIGVFVLLLACINFMNLSTAKSEKRAKEVGIRKTIGSKRKQLVMQFFSESLLTVGFAFALSILIAALSLPFFNQVADKQMSLPWTNFFFWLASIVFVLIIALVAGSYPAFYLSSFKPVKVLKGTFKAGRYTAIPRKILVVLQFTVSVTLIIATIIVYKQIEFAKDRSVGYSRANLIAIPTSNGSIHDHFDVVKNELVKAGAITSLAEAGTPTTSIWNSTSGLSWRGKDPNLSVDFGMVYASPEYGKTIDWHIKEGRNFSKDFPTDTTALIINEAAARYMNLKNPVGENVTWFGQPYSIIGVVKDMVMESPYAEPKPVVYADLNGQGDLALLKLNPSVSTHEAINKIGTVFKSFNTEQPFEYTFVDDDYAKKF